MQRRPKEERRQDIAEVALQIIGRQGLHKLTTSLLSQEVGLAEGTIFRHFSSKEEILDAALDLFEQRLFDGFPPKEDRPLRRLRSFVQQRIRTLQSYPEMRVLAFNEQLPESEEAWTQRIQQLRVRSLHFVETCIKDAQSSDEIASDLPSSFLVWLVIGVIRGTVSAPPHHHPNPGLEAEQAWIYLELLLRRTR